MEAALDRFRAAHTQVLGVSIDSVHSHANWGRDLGGVSFPLLSDFEPKGAVARSFGHYLPDAGVTDRATVIVDKSGVVRYSASVTPAGQRSVDELVAACEQVDAGQDPGALPAPRPIPDGTVLFVKSKCGHSRRARVALDNLRLAGTVAVRNVSEDPPALADLERIGGKGQAPCLIWQGEPVYESAVLIARLADHASPLC